MHKKTDTQDFDIPTDDIECWTRYPKYRWVYDLSRLLDAQHIKWSPFKDDGSRAEPNMHFDTNKPIFYNPSIIYLEEPVGDRIETEVYITKGEIKLLRHVKFDSTTCRFKEINGLIGSVEIRISAFVTLHFQKFTGVISATTIGSDIYAIHLRPITSLAFEANQEVIRLAKRIYKRTDTVIGLTDRAIHESLAS